MMTRQSIVASSAALILMAGCSLFHQGRDSGMGDGSVEAEIEAACTAVGAVTHVAVSARPVDGDGCLVIQLVASGTGERWPDVSVSAGTSIESMGHTDRACEEALRQPGTELVGAMSASGSIELEYPPLHGRASNVSVDLDVVLVDGRNYVISGFVESGGGPYCPE